MVPLLAGVATAIGILYPYIKTEELPGEAPDTSKVMRCVAVFVGIYQASTVSLGNYGSLVQLVLFPGSC